MHLKAAIIPLLVLSTFIIIPSTALSVEWKDLPMNEHPDYATTAITVGPYSLFASAWVPVYAFNADTRTATAFDWTISVDFAHTVINNELLVFGGGNLVDDKLTVFDATSQQTSTIGLGFYATQFAITSVGNKVVMAGGYRYAFTSEESSGATDFVGVYDTATQTMTNYTLPAPTLSMRSASAGNFAVFAAGFYMENATSSVASNKAFVFNTATKTWNTATINAHGLNAQSISIGRFAIFVSGNTADIFDSDTQSWSTHTLTQDASVVSYDIYKPQFGFSITKTSRYVFIVGQGVADVFDSQTQTWSTLDIEPSTSAKYCPSTTVDNNYAIFVCGDVLSFYDITTKEIIRQTRPGNTVIQAGSVGKIATLFGELLNSKLGMRLYDFTTGPGTPETPISDVPRVITPTQVSVPFSTHQLTSPRPSHYSVANKAVFVNNDDKTVEIYDPETESWSTSSSDSSRGSVIAAADDFLVFSDKTNTSVLHVLDVETKSWSTTEVSPHAGNYLETAGNYVFFAGRDYTGPVIAYDISNDSWIVAATYEGWYGGGDSFVPIKYKSYMVLLRPSIMTTYAIAWNTANGLERTSFGYGAGSSRIVPSYGVAGDYLVIAGGVYDTGFAPGISITDRETGYVYSGNMPTARYSLTILYAKPLVMIVGGDLLETFNMETQQWQSSIFSVAIPDTRVSVGNRLFFSYNGQTNGVEFDSTTRVWSNITFAGSRVGTVFKLNDVASFVDSDNIVTFNPNTQQWTKVQLSLSSNTRLTEAFVVGDKVIVVSSDGLTVRVTDFAQLVSSVPTPTPTTPQSSATPTSPSTPTTVPWSPWTAPVSDTPRANQPTAHTPLSPANPSSPSTNSPSTTQTPINDGNNNSPTVTGPGNPGPSVSPVSSSSSPSSSDSSPTVTVAVPVSGSNLEATSSSSTISATAFVSVMAAVLLFL